MENVAVLTEMQNHLETLRAGKGKVHPGQPAEFTDAMHHNNDVMPDGIPQGDLNLILASKIPDHYSEVPLQGKLVPGDTTGSRHELNVLEGEVKFYLHDEWNGNDYDGIEGPYLELKEGAKVEIEHPTHGNVTATGPRIIECRYQREYDAEQKRERRNAD